MSRAHLVAFCCLALTLVGHPAYAGSDPPFPPVPASELGLTSEPLAPGAPAIILFRQVDRDDSTGSSHEYHHWRIKILTEEGRKYGNIEIPFFKDIGEEVKDIRARTVRPNGSIVDFDGKVTEQTIVRAKKYKYLAKVLTLPEVQVGSIVEYSFNYRLDHLYGSGWTVEDELFTKRAEFSLKPYSGERVGLRCSWHGLPTNGPQPSQGPDHIFRLALDNVSAFQVEDYMPPAYEMKAHVDFVYRWGAFEDDQDKFWKDMGKALNEGIEKFMDKRDAMRQAVSQIVLPDDPPETKLKKIYARVQQLKNTSYQRSKTEKEEKRENEKADNNVADVWKRGYGTGWQLTWLYLALVRAAGFEGHAVLAPSRARHFFDPKMMDARKLDANLVLVKDNGKDRFFDPGAAFLPFGLLPWFETGVTALRLDRDGGTWIQVPMAESAASKVERVAGMKLLDSGDLEGKVTITYTGLEARQRRLEEREADQVARKNFLEDELKSDVPATIDAELTNQPLWEASTEPLVAEYRVRIPGWASGVGRRVLLPVGIFSSPEKHIFEHANRVHPIYMEYLFQKLDDVTIELPSGWTASSVPPAQKQGGNVISYTLAVENNKTKIHMSRTMTVDFMLLSVKYYPALQKFYQDMRTGDEQQIVLLPTATSASN